MLPVGWTLAHTVYLSARFLRSIIIMAELSFSTAKARSTPCSGNSLTLSVDAIAMGRVNGSGRHLICSTAPCSVGLVVVRRFGPTRSLDPYGALAAQREMMTSSRAFRAVPAVATYWNVTVSPAIGYVASRPWSLALPLMLIDQ